MNCCEGSKTRLAETFRPVLTSRAAAALFSSVIRLMAPFSSSSPHRPQLRRSVNHDCTSSSDGIRGSDWAAPAGAPAARAAADRDRCRSSSSAGEKLSGATGRTAGPLHAAAGPPMAALPAAAVLNVVRNRRLEEAIGSSFLLQPFSRSSMAGRGRS